MPVPCFSSTDCIQLAFDPVTGLSAEPILVPNDEDGVSSLQCTPDGLQVAMHRYRAFATIAQAISSGGDYLNFQTVDYDVGFTDAAPSTITIPADGLYLGVAQVTLALLADADLSIKFEVNGGNPAFIAEQRLKGVSNETPSIQVTFMQMLNANDLIRVRANSTPARNTVPGPVLGRNVWVSLTRLSA